MVLVCRRKQCMRARCPKMSAGHLARCPWMPLRCPCALAHLARMPAAPTQIPSTEAVARVGLTRDQVMTASEVAELLHLPVSTVYHLARRGELPARRLGRTWRFLRPRLEEMLRA
jgi:excisionase family DNA binding protein